VFTAWSVSGYPHDNVGQWWQITFPAKRNLNSLQVSLLAESKKRSRITKLRVSTQAGSRVSTLRNTEDLQQIKVPAGPTSWLRLTILSVTKGTDELYGPGLREVTVPGLPITSVAALPDDAQKFFSGAGPSNQTFVLTRDRDDPLAALDTDPEQQLARRFVVQRGADFAVRGTAVASTGFQLPAGATAKPNLNLACGTGPTIMIDGHPYPTALHGSPYSYTSGQPVDMWLCDLRPIHLSAGPHTIRSVPGYLPLRVATMTITSPDAQPSASTATRQGTPRKWGNEHRTISLPAGPAVVLTVHENFNASWSATLDGRRLSPIRVDGWQQGFVVPAGPAGTVVLTNSPGIALQRQLIVAAALVLLLLLAAAIPARRLRPAPTAARDLPRWLGAVAGVGAAALALLFTAGPAVAAAVPAAALLVWLTRREAPLLLIGVLAAATVLEVTEHQHFVASGQGAFSPAAQICVAAALGLGVLLSVPVLRPRPRQDGPETPARTATDQPHGQSASPAQDL
jgi:arabinofuranan 3-O-arabinosyltransferase